MGFTPHSFLIRGEFFSSGIESCNTDPISGPCIHSYFYSYKEGNLGSNVNVARDRIQSVVKIHRVAL